jgi:hypothetical protein
MTVEQDEIIRRNNYWMEHWQEFTCTVVVHTPHSANAHVGGFMGHLFGSIPLPMHTTESDRGQFSIHDGCIWVMGRYRTYCWAMQDTQVVWFYDGSGVEIRLPGQPVITLLGPVAAPIVGAYRANGLPVAGN